MSKHVLCSNATPSKRAAQEADTVISTAKRHQLVSHQTKGLTVKVFSYRQSYNNTNCVAFLSLMCHATRPPYAFPCFVEMSYATS